MVLRRVFAALVVPLALTAVPATNADAAGPRGYAVGTRVVTFVDRTRPTPSFGATAASPQRLLVTHLWYPAAGPAGTLAPRNAHPEHRGGPFPLIVFAHGNNGRATNYAPMLQAWAAAGYVVAAPDFPVSSRSDTAGINDVGAQPADLQFVLTQVLRLDRGLGGLGRIIDIRRIGVAGHSLGAATVVALVERSCCRDPRVKAAISFSGLALVPGEDYPRPSTPLLLVHGTADMTVPYAGSVNVYEAAGRPRFLLTIMGRGHQSWPAGTMTGDTAVLRATLDFWAGYLRHDAGARVRLRHDAVVPGVTTLRAGAQ